MAAPIDLAKRFVTGMIAQRVSPPPFPFASTVVQEEAALHY